METYRADPTSGNTSVPRPGEWVKYVIDNLKENHHSGFVHMDPHWRPQVDKLLLIVLS